VITWFALGAEREQRSDAESGFPNVAGYVGGDVVRDADSYG
jgi:hypothetical protein